MRYAPAYVVPLLALCSPLHAQNSDELPPTPRQGGTTAVEVFSGVQFQQIELEDGVVQLRGWITSTDASVPEGLAIEVAGVRYTAIEIVRNKRTDVMRHFGLRDIASARRADACMI